jgi:hypothetical protein
MTLQLGMRGLAACFIAAVFISIDSLGDSPSDACSTICLWEECSNLRINVVDPVETRSDVCRGITTLLKCYYRFV